MNYQGVVLTGTSGAGKTTITRLLERGFFKQVQAVTTRQSRQDDRNEYEYLSQEKFDEKVTLGELVIKTKYRNFYYGITKNAVLKVINEGKIPILVITPHAASEYSKINGEFNFLSIFIDANDSELDKRLTLRGDPVDGASRERRLDDRRYRDDFLYHMINNSAEKTCGLIEGLWEYRLSSGVLSKRIISLMLECGMLLHKASQENVKGASYDLSLGDEFYYKGKIEYLTEKSPFLLIEPYDYVVTTSKELTDFPRDITGRFDLSVSLFCQGIILSNGPCVDPGFRGRLFCLLFNTSNAPIYLKRGQHYATLEVSKLIEPTIAYSGKYQDKNSIVDYLPTNALQGGINELKKELESIKQRNEHLQTAVSGAVAIFLAVLAILLTIK